MTTTRTITGKDTNPFSEGHETKPYSGGRKTEVLGEKTTTFLRGMAENPIQLLLTEPNRDGPKVKDGMASLTKSISGWYPLNIRGLEKAEG